MTKCTYIWLLLFFAIGAKAQNMVPNGDFEQLVNCPTDGDQVSKCKGWSRYHQGTSDYFNTCGSADICIPSNAFGIQPAVSGNAYMGVYVGRTPDSTDYKEYIKRIITPLIKNTVYEVSMSVSLADISQFGANGIGVWLYDKAPVYTGSNRLPVTPQILFPDVVTDKVNWVRLSQTFIADSFYGTMVIGGFLPSISMNTIQTGTGSIDWCYYYIDSVVIRKVSRIAMNFTAHNFCAGDTITVPFVAYDSNYFWAGNVFSLQLSDTTGSFGNFTKLATIAGKNGDTFRYVIPQGILPGSHYRIRIMSDAGFDSSVFSEPFVIGNTIPAKPNAGSNAPVCTGSTLYLTASSTTPGVNYTWSGPRGYRDSSQNPVISVGTQSDSGSYVVTAWLFGCSASDTVTAGIVRVIGYVNNTVNDPVCDNDSLILSGHVIGKALSYSWVGPGGFSAAVKDTVVLNPATSLSGKYVFIAYFKGCTSADTLDVSVRTAPMMPDAGPDLSICDGDTLRLTGNTVTPGITYSWTGPNGMVTIGQTLLLTSAATSMNGEYICTVDQNGCTNTDTVNVVVKHGPPAPNVSSNSPLELGETLKMSINNAQVGVSYNWHGPNNFASVLLDPRITNVNKLNAGIYYIGASLNGCNASNLLFVTVDGIIDPASVIVFPNPNNGNFTIRASVAIDQVVPIVINSSNGQVVYQSKVQTQNQLLNVQVSLKDVLSSGLYALRLSIDGRERVVNLVVDRER